jgi:hypothetical protein
LVSVSFRLSQGIFICQSTIFFGFDFILFLYF